MNESLARLLARVLDTSCGTLWWVREDLWEESSDDYRANPDRDGHPGLSVAERSLLLPSERVPLLIGFGNDRGPFIARGLSKHRGADAPTSFGQVVRPAPVPAQEWVKPAPDVGRGVLEGPGYWRSRVLLNHHKPRLTEKEREALETWLRKRKLL